MNKQILFTQRKTLIDQVTDLLRDQILLVEGCQFSRTITPEFLQVYTHFPETLMRALEDSLKRTVLADSTPKPLAGSLPVEVDNHGEGHFQVSYSEASEKVLAFITGLLDVCCVHSSRLPNIKSLSKCASKLFIYSLLDTFEDIVKYQTAYLFALVTCQTEFPERPNISYLEMDGVILGGWFMRKFSRIIEKHNRTKLLNPSYVGFAYSVMNIKRACPAISSKKQDMAIKKHKLNMTGAAYKGDQIVEKQFYLSSLKSRIAAVCQKVYKYVRFSKDPKWVDPSVSASYQNPKRNGGANGFIGGRLFTLDETCLQGYFSYKTKVSEFKTPYFMDEVMDITMQDALKDVMEGQVHKVLEPFKVRPITTGPVSTYQVCRMIQRELHGELREHKAFQLIGKPASEDIITDRLTTTNFDNVFEMPMERQLYSNFRSNGDLGFNTRDDDGTVLGTVTFDRLSSVDYQAATDGMNPELSSYYCDCVAIMTDMDPTLSQIFRKSMLGHSLVYSRSKDDPFGPLPRVQQTWGQLMGSPTSFPALCVVNYAVLWVAAEECFNTTFAYEDIDDLFRPLFNGDDGLFLSNEKLHGVWRDVATVAGLTPSVGKSYCHPDLAMINSEIYMPNKIGMKSDRFLRVFALNPGLIKGQGRVLNDTRNVSGVDSPCKDSNVTPMCDQLEKCKVAASLDQCHTIDYLFYHHNMEKLKNTHRSWILPRPLGGLGLRFGTITKEQMSLATGILMGLDGLGSVGESVNRPDYLCRAEANMDIIRGELETEFWRKSIAYTKDQYEQAHEHCSDVYSVDESTGELRQNLAFEIPKITHLYLGHDNVDNEETQNERFAGIKRKAVSSLNKFSKRRKLGLTSKSEEERYKAAMDCGTELARISFQREFPGATFDPNLYKEDTFYVRCVGGRGTTISPIKFW